MSTARVKLVKTATHTTPKAKGESVWEFLDPFNTKAFTKPSESVSGQATTKALKSVEKSAVKAAGEAAGSALSEIWKGIGGPLMRIAKVIGGALMILVGIWLLVRALSPSAAGVIATAAPPVARTVVGGAAQAPRTARAAVRLVKR